MIDEHIIKQKPNNDECYTPRYGVEPLLEFMEPYREKIIWCPFDTQESEFVKVFTESGFRVVHSHIETGQNFFSYQPDKWDVIISNPPFTNKSDIFRRALYFDKPFALLMKITWLNDGTPANVFKDKELQILSFNERMTFKNQPQQGKISFLSAYFCYKFLPRDFIFRTFRNIGQKRLPL